jgi:tellurite methyltransferase
MATNYEDLYRKTPHALGEPTAVFVKVFESYPKINARVLDIGCGRGRDALFIVRLGHQVVGVDISKSGVSNLLEESTRENLNISCEITDIRQFRPKGEFDVIVIDRTLHMLNEPDRLSVLISL